MEHVDASGEIAADLAFVDMLRHLRVRFQHEIAGAVPSADPDVLLALRQETFFQFAEFFYALRTHGIDSADKLERLARLHNDHLVELSQDRERMRRYGLTPERLEAAMFTGDNLRKLLANFAGPMPGIDQSDLSRLLVTVMSAETCRKLVLAAEAAGFIERVRRPGAVLVVSKGDIERIFGKVIREARYLATGS
ncbi:MAG: hypothetical protein EOP22_15290 [Hyphomicrobiales bacterium]|nr:MAG: hypothetical protein EOP22_15290 [Hyphomicrobiales bacterium]